VGRARAGRRLSVEPVALEERARGAASGGGDAGLIWCDMPDFARFRYWRDPEATAAAWRGRAATVGDLGRLDEDGFLYLTGRRHDLIISGGVNVYPAEVENVLAAVPGVAEVAVFGLPDDRWGQRVCAAFVTERTASSATEAEEALRAAASDRLAPYKRPKTYIRAMDLPHTATGKLMRRAVPAHLGLAAG
jgi:long-chain acyl-CoA synthetase